jgi:hypothetical protein
MGRESRANGSAAKAKRLHYKKPVVADGKTKTTIVWSHAQLREKLFAKVQ